MKKILLCCIGTRPEAIKMAPVILTLKQQSWAAIRVLATAQHRHMLDQVLNFFAIKPDVDLDIMGPNQALTTLTARLLLELAKVLQAEKPDAVLAQGDTTTVMSMPLACFCHRIPFGHVEAGLRTWGPLPNGTDLKNGGIAEVMPRGSRAIEAKYGRFFCRAVY